MTEGEKLLHVMAKKAQAYDLNVRLQELAAEHQAKTIELQKVNAEIAEMQKPAEVPK